MKTLSSLFLVFVLGTLGCKGYQLGHILKPNDKDMVGSHSAGAGTYNPMVDEAVGKLLGEVDQTEGNFSRIGGGPNPDPDIVKQPLKICFVGIENRSAEELGDFKEQLYEKIDTLVNDHWTAESISRQYVDAGLELTRLRPEELFQPENMRIFSATMEQNGQPFDYMLFAKLTSGTTIKNTSKQRDYLMTLSLVNVRDGRQFKQSAEVKKGYHQSSFARIANYNPFKKKQ